MVGGWAYLQGRWLKWRNGHAREGRATYTRPTTRSGVIWRPTVKTNSPRLDHRGVITVLESWHRYCIKEKVMSAWSNISNSRAVSWNSTIVGITCTSAMAVRSVCFGVLISAFIFTTVAMMEKLWQSGSFGNIREHEHEWLWTHDIVGRLGWRQWQITV